MAETKQLTELPYNAKIHEPLEKKSQVVFILVHHYGGNNRTLYRHIKLVNSLGFTAVSFELEGAHNQKVFLPPISKNYKWGLRHMWTDRIEEILRLVPGEKIIFTLSNPSYSVLDAVYRTEAKNIKAIICDGGPFFDIVKCYWNLFRYGYKCNVLVSILQLILGAIYWNPTLYKKDARKFIKSFDTKVPLLSIRSEKDLLVPLISIEKCLSNYDKNMIKTVIIPEVGHLMGIKHNKALYNQVIVDFLSNIKL